MKCRHETPVSQRCLCTAEIDPCLGYDKCERFQPDYKTNADHIRSMTDEELAKWVTKFVELVLEDNGLDDKYRLDPNFETNLLDTLKLPCKEDT